MVSVYICKLVYMDANIISCLKSICCKYQHLRQAYNYFTFTNNVKTTVARPLKTSVGGKLMVKSHHENGIKFVKNR